MSLCMGCMQELNGSVICPNCHFDNSEVQSAPFLPFGTELAGRYVTGTGLETNGESTRYIAFDKQTGDVVIVSEFLPIGLFSRDEGQTELKVNYDDRLAFNKLRDEFISYFRIISELKDLSALTNIVDVLCVIVCVTIISTVPILFACIVPSWSTVAISLFSVS